MGKGLRPFLLFGLIIMSWVKTGLFATVIGASRMRYAAYWDCRHCKQVVHQVEKKLTNGNSHFASSRTKPLECG